MSEERKTKYIVLPDATNDLKHSKERLKSGLGDDVTFLTGDNDQELDKDLSPKDKADQKKRLEARMKELRKSGYHKNLSGKELRALARAMEMAGKREPNTDYKIVTGNEKTRAVVNELSEGNQNFSGIDDYEMVGGKDVTSRLKDKGEEWHPTQEQRKIERRRSRKIAKAGRIRGWKEMAKHFFNPNPKHRSLWQAYKYGRAKGRAKSEMKRPGLDAYRARQQPQQQSPQDPTLHATQQAQNMDGQRLQMSQLLQRQQQMMQQMQAFVTQLSRENRLLRERMEKLEQGQKQPAQSPQVKEQEVQTQDQEKEQPERKGLSPETREEVKQWLKDTEDWKEKADRRRQERQQPKGPSLDL